MMEAKVKIVLGLVKGLAHGLVIPYFLIYLFSFIAGIWSLLGGLWIVFALIVYLNIPQPKLDQVVAKIVVQSIATLIFIYFLLIAF